MAPRKLKDIDVLYGCRGFHRDMKKARWGACLFHVLPPMGAVKRFWALEPLLMTGRLSSFVK